MRRFFERHRLVISAIVGIYFAVQVQLLPVHNDDSTLERILTAPSMFLLYGGLAYLVIGVPAWREKRAAARAVKTAPEDPRRRRRTRPARTRAQFQENYEAGSMLIAILAGIAVALASGSAPLGLALATGTFFALVGYDSFR